MQYALLCTSTYIYSLFFSVELIPSSPVSSRWRFLDLLASLFSFLDSFRLRLDGDERLPLLHFFWGAQGLTGGGVPAGKRAGVRLFSKTRVSLCCLAFIASTTANFSSPIGADMRICRYCGKDSVVLRKTLGGGE